LITVICGWVFDQSLTAMDFLTAGLAVMRLHRELITAHAVFAEHGVSAFECRGDADLDLVGISRPSADNR
jgi:hypothetical protein